MKVADVVVKILASVAIVFVYLWLCSKIGKFLSMSDNYPYPPSDDKEEDDEL